MATLGAKFGAGHRGYGQGIPVDPAKLPAVQTLTFKDFTGGYFASDAPEEAPDNSTPGGTDVEIDSGDMIIRAPGAVDYEDLTPAAAPVTQIAVHAGLDFRSELMLFAAPKLGIKREGATVWSAVLADEVGRKPFFWATYGEEFYFSAGGEKVYKHVSHEDGISVSGVAAGKTLAVWAGRMWVGGALIEGSLEPLGLLWSGVDGAEDTSVDTGFGFEFLIQDNRLLGDEIVALRPMGFDLMVILLKRSIWVARRTGELTRPADFIPRDTGKGCVSERTAQVVDGGVIFLSDEGLELFDGNGCTHLSAAIDSEILPLNYDKINDYTGTYNPHTQRYMLFVPSVGTFVLDLLRKRWYKRSLLALDGTPFSLQFHATTWSEAAGTWADAVGTWNAQSPTEYPLPDMIFLGQKAGGAYFLQKESFVSSSYFGVTQAPIYVFPVKPGTNDLMLATTKEVRVTYKQGGSVGVQLRDNAGDLVEVGVAELSLSDKARVRAITGMFTGKGLGPALRLIDSSLPAEAPVGNLTVINGVTVGIDPYAPAESYGGDFQSGAGTGPSVPINLNFSGRGVRKVTVSQITGRSDDHLVPAGDYLLVSGTVFSVDGIPMSINPCFVPPDSAPGSQFSSRADTAASTPITVLFNPPAGTEVYEVRLTAYNSLAGSWMRAYDAGDNLIGQVQFGYVGGVGALAPDGTIGWVNANGDPVNTPYSRKVLNVAGIRKIILTPPAANFVTYGQFNFRTESVSGVGTMKGYNSLGVEIATVDFDAVAGVLTTSNKSIEAEGIVHAVLTPPPGAYVVYEGLSVVTEITRLRIARAEFDVIQRSPRLDPAGVVGNFV